MDTPVDSGFPLICPPWRWAPRRHDARLSPMTAEPSERRTVGRRMQLAARRLAVTIIGGAVLTAGLVMIVTPHLVRPMRKDARFPPLPGAETDDYDPGYTEWLLGEDGDLDEPSAFGFSR